MHQAIVIAAGLALGGGPPRGQPCDLHWSDEFHGPALNAAVRALTVFDDGTGPAIYAGGDFSTGNGGAACGVARLDGDQWSALGGGLEGEVHALAVFDDGSGAGPALYAGGYFATARGSSSDFLSRWNGTFWSPLPGINGVVKALALFDDGSGPALYIGGSFTTAGGIPADRIARWDGSTWSPLGTGVNGSVEAMAVFDDGSGPALHVGGGFTAAGGLPANCVARWDGEQWLALGDGTNTSVFSLAVFDDGSGGGPALYAAGGFTAAGGLPANRVARWDGTSWSALGDGLNDTARALAVFDRGAGTALYAGGEFLTAGGVSASRIARWDGETWSPLQTGTDFAVLALAAFDTCLYVGGQFSRAGATGARNIGRWDGTAWSIAGSAGGGTNSVCRAFAVFDDGAGEALHVGGQFTTAGEIAAHHIARWDGDEWTSVGGGVGQEGELNVGFTYALHVFNDGSVGGPALYAGGSFITAGGAPAEHIARWDGQGWSALGSGTNGLVFSLAEFDDGSGGAPALYAGGAFTTADDIAANRIARWDGAAWEAVGEGTDGQVLTMVVFDDGSGPALYVGGAFGVAGGAPASGIARWDGSSWSSVGGGVSNCVGFNCVPIVHALAVFDDGSGPALYAGGNFTTAGGGEANFIARWDGSSWSPLGIGMSGCNGGGNCSPSVFELIGFDDGTGPALYAGGRFASAGGLDVYGIATWDGASWSAVGEGVSGGSVLGFGIFDDRSGAGPALYAGGAFAQAGGLVSERIGRWGCPVFGDLDGDGVVGLVDFELLLDAWGPCPPPCPPGCAADLDGDCEVGILDFLMMLANWG
ncbi:MAG: hypothetical protein ACYTES_19035 [Planctomycetota bacterium]|jgi:hypothetical protein